MAEHPIEQTAAQQFGGGLLGLAIVVCSMEMVPGWGFLNLGWSQKFFFQIIALVGAVSGLLIGGRYLLPGLLGGMLGGLGALWAISMVLSNVNETWNIVLVLVGFIGAAPGICVFFGGKLIQDAVAPPPADSMTTSNPASIDAPRSGPVDLEQRTKDQNQ
jgi:hypothetical protein